MSEAARRAGLDGVTAAGSVDPQEWDRFVAEATNGAYTQLSAWADVKRANGWEATYVVERTPGATVGAQVLVRRFGRLPWAVGYAPRGPIADALGGDALSAWTSRLRDEARRNRLAYVAIDPEVEAGRGLEESLSRAGWKRGTPVQPDRTRLIELNRTEEELLADLRSKWRQYVHKARRAGVVVVDGDEHDLDEFYRIYVETARRAGFVHRAPGAYADVYRAFASRGSARLLFAKLPTGESVATLMLISCGRRVIEPYGGMTDAGAATRANYLLKWEAIRSSRERGFAVYDLWGLAHGGIEQFKEGFGGREVRYVGAWELVTNRAVHLAVGLGQRVRVALARRGQQIGAAGNRRESVPLADAG